MQLFLPPAVGLADNGDFPRIIGIFRIGYIPGVSEAIESNYYAPQYIVRDDRLWKSGFYSSEQLLVIAAIPFHNLTSKDGLFDIRTMGVVHFLLSLLGMTLLIRATRPLPAAGRWAAIVLSIAFVTDVGYVAFFNSFFSETASALFLLLTIACAIGCAADDAGRHRFPLIAFTVAAVLFVWAKPQNVLGGLLFAGMIVVMYYQREERRRASLIAAAVLICASVAIYVSTPRYIRDWTYQVAVFWEILGHSPAPTQDLRDLGLPAYLVRYSGTHPWQPKAPSRDDPAFKRDFLNHMTFGKLLAFYAARPRRTLQSFNRSASFALQPIPDLGNFAMDSGMPPRAKSHAFSYIGRWRSSISPHSFAGLAVAGIVYLIGVIVWLRKSQTPFAVRVGLLITTIWAICASQFLLVAITQGTIDPVKHMFLFRTCYDVLVIAGIAALIHATAASLTNRHRMLAA